jgi:N-acetylmuramoyl-L-alanine amidase
MAFTATVIGCDEWGAAAPTVAAFERTHPRWIIVHHTGLPNPPGDRSQRTRRGAMALARKIQHDHMVNRGWSDTGQNFLVSTGGFVLEGRHGSLAAVRAGQCVRSAHAPQSPGKLAGGNESPGIETEGNFMKTAMAAQQWASLVDLCVLLCRSLDLPPEAIRGHRDFTDTDCPGDWLYAQLPQLRSEVEQRLGVSLSVAEAVNA